MSVTTVGAQLRAAREALGLSHRDMAEITKIQVPYLECLEADRFEELPAEVFVRGFLRSYARELRLDEESLFEHYLRQTGQGANPVREQLEAGITSADNETRDMRYTRRSRAGKFAYGIGLGLLVLALALSVLVLGGGSERDMAASNYGTNAAETWQPAGESSSDWRSNR